MMKNFRLKSVPGLLVVITVLTLLSTLILISVRQPQEKPQELEEWEGSCTSIMAGRLATTDGSVITAHSCDGNYRTWLNIVPH
ncbi:MAG: peptidase, partial [Candidatus Aminicenantes bacterium]|nr:peptidase [Candidatus Aminicenantes bacterium]